LGTIFTLSARITAVRGRPDALPLSSRMPTPISEAPVDPLPKGQRPVTR
jgi:hypothetical protein